MTTGTTAGDVVTIDYRAGWLAFNVAHLPAVQALCFDQKERFMTDASAIHVELEESEG
jgi:hypothetical protein